ncbi:4'-phosphopantetheinyl transferase family protein [Pseudoalteromonas luteoviolacea]|uniref:4'-phosphopantetheinyl transferase family protein n=1 Tax=Pseudoalteromonas luteoviolacea TaxID=43657 RepID=UPI00115399E7|nr:4'-phosphopantetheinyl transferase superfamily protein [Pseudoalteromonas luteoviolacea]TQF72395.1 4'-phosphopantetheinyl transferase superfamily protein [Pseudoalteromonas luteoviolacea]
MHITDLSPFTPKLPYSSHCMAFNVSQYQDEDYAFFGQPFPSKLQRAVAKRKAEYLAGRVCASRAMKSCGIANFTLHSAEDRSPIWPENIRGTITHSKGIAMAMVSDSIDVLGIGIDIEHHMTEKQEQELRSQILRDDEHDAFELLRTYHEKPLTIVFSAKESIYKALYGQVQTFFGFDAAQLIKCDEYRLQFSLTKTLHDDLPKGTEITVYYQSVQNMVLTECVNLKR